MLRLNYDANLEALSVKSCDVSWVGSNRGRRQVSSSTPGTLLIILAGRLQSQALPCTSSLLSSSSACCLPLVSLLIHSNVSESSRQREREKDDQMAVDGALIKAIEVVSELNTCLCTVFIAQGMEPNKLVF
ncbi:hypothetical protein Bca4012_100543 [Brassica carinata]